MAYFNAVWTLVKVVFRLEPRLCTTAMMDGHNTVVQPFDITASEEMRYEIVRRKTFSCYCWSAKQC